MVGSVFSENMAIIGIFPPKTKEHKINRSSQGLQIDSGFHDKATKFPMAWCARRLSWLNGHSSPPSRSHSDTKRHQRAWREYPGRWVQWFGCQTWIFFWGKLETSMLWHMSCNKKALMARIENTTPSHVMMDASTKSGLLMDRIIEWTTVLVWTKIMMEATLKVQTWRVCQGQSWRFYFCVGGKTSMMRGTSLITASGGKYSGSMLRL